jgi:hypothetical protein
MSANPAFKYPSIVVGTPVRVVRSINGDPEFLGSAGRVTAVYGFAGMPIQVWFEDREYSAMFAEDELEVVK